MLKIIITIIGLTSAFVNAQDDSSSADLTIETTTETGLTTTSTGTLDYSLTPSEILFFDTMTGSSTDAGSWNSTTLEYEAGTAADGSTNLNYTQAQIAAKSQLKSAIDTQTTSVTSSIEGTTSAVASEGDETQQTLVTMIGQTNRILEYYLQQTPSMIRKGLYGTEGLSAVKLKSIEQTLPDPVATLVKTQQEIAAAIDPFNPSGQSAETATLELDRKIRDSFAGISTLVTPNSTTPKNRYEYTARLLTKLLYPVVLGGKEAGSSGTTPTIDSIVESVQASGSLASGGQIYSAFVKPSTPDSNITHNISDDDTTGEEDKAALNTALADDDFKKAAEVFIQLTNLKYRYENCFENFQKATSGSATDAISSGSGNGPEYIIANLSGLQETCQSDDAECVNETPACGPIIEATNLTAKEKINAKYGNGWAQLITDTESVISNTIAITNTSDITVSNNLDSGFIDCDTDDDLTAVCQSANYTLAKLTETFQESLSLTGTGDNQSVYAQNFKTSYDSKDILTTLKPYVSNFQDTLEDPLNSLYAYLFLKLEQSINNESSDTSTTETSTSTTSTEDLNKANFPSYSNFIQNETYETTTADDTSLLECTETTGVPEPVITIGESANTYSAMQYIDSMSKMDSSGGLKLEGLPIPQDWQNDSGDQHQIVLVAGAWVPLTKLKSETTTELQQFNYQVEDSYYIAGKSADVTETTYSKRPGFYQSFEAGLDTKISNETSAMLGKTTAYSTLLHPYQQRNTKYAFSCSSLTNNIDKTNRTVYMTPIQAMKQSSTWRLKNTQWREGVATMDTNNLLREMLFLLAEMRQMQFEQYLQLEKNNTLAAAQVANSSAGAAAMDNIMGGSNDLENYVIGRKQNNTSGSAGEAATDSADSATSAMGSLDSSGATGDASAATTG